MAGLGNKLIDEIKNTTIQKVKEFGKVTSTVEGKNGFLLTDGTIIDIGVETHDDFADFITKGGGIGRTEKLVDDLGGAIRIVNLGPTTDMRGFITKPEITFDVFNQKPTQAQADIMAKESVNSNTYVVAKNKGLPLSGEFRGIGNRQKIMDFFNKTFKGGSKLLGAIPGAAIAGKIGSKFLGPVGDAVDIGSTAANFFQGQGSSGTPIGSQQFQNPLLRKLLQQQSGGAL